MLNIFLAKIIAAFFDFNDSGRLSYLYQGGERQ